MVQKRSERTTYDLKDNENIMYVTSGLYNNNTYLIVCTDLRLLFLDKGMIYGLKFHEFPFEKINSVSYKKGLLFGEIIIHHGSSSIAIGSISKTLYLEWRKQYKNKSLFEKVLWNHPILKNEFFCCWWINKI